MDGLATVTDDRLGRVVAVSGSQVVMLIAPHAAAVAASETKIPLFLGALVKVRTAVSIVFGVVTGLSVPKPETETPQAELKLVELELIGEVAQTASGRARFRRGVSIFPGLGESVFAATPDDLALVYACPSVAASRIGTIHQARSLPLFVMTDELLGKHFAVLGNTGTGKSCAVALILHAILAKHKNGHVVLLDMHNEYAQSFRDKAEVLNLGNFELPYWLFNFEEIEEILLTGSRERQAESALLAELILLAKQAYIADPKAAKMITVDTPVPYRLGDVDRMLDDAAGKLEKTREAGLYSRLKAKLTSLRSDPRFAFMFPTLAVRDNMQGILSKLFRIPVRNKPVSIVDLSSVPSEILNVVVSVLCRMTFDFALWSERSVPMLLVCEEAHRYCPADQRLGFEPAKRALSRIAKEGRKYGVALCVVSQRPSELAPEVLSQCNTIFALRLSNAADQDFLRGALRESALGLLEFLPSLGNAEAIAMGEGVPVPARLCFDELPANYRPMSGTANFSSAWTNDVDNANFLNSIIERWRRAGR
jgi:DNA helicase HerA-like ATPase